MEGSGIICKLSSEELGKEIFDFFLEALDQLHHQELIYVGLSGGRSFNEFYLELFSRRKEISCCNQLRFFFVDERVVPLTSDDSNYKLVTSLLFTNLISEGLISSNQIITIDDNSECIALNYGSKVPKIDIGFFGSGEDGHIASLFPNHSLLESREDTFISIYDSPKPPLERVTLSPKMIEEISFSCIVFKGSGKQLAFDKFRNEENDILTCPAKLIMKSKNWKAFSDLE